MEPPALFPMCRIVCAVGPLVELGDAPLGARRDVPLGTGEVSGPALNGRLVEGGIDWQWLRRDGALEIRAHYVIRADDGALIEVHSDGLRHGPAEVMEALARGEAVPPQAYFFRTFIRWTTGAAAWDHLNRTMSIAVAEREARTVVLRVFGLR
jgi:hypothetical protein